MEAAMTRLPLYVKGYPFVSRAIDPRAMWASGLCSNISTFNALEPPMSITTMTSREFNQDASRAKKAAESGPVFITDRGRPAHVLLSIEEYQRLTHQRRSIVDALAMTEEVEFDPPRSRELPRPADLD
jgi:prevent-host-death family protein